MKPDSKKEPPPPPPFGPLAHVYAATPRGVHEAMKGRIRTITRHSNEATTIVWVRGDTSPPPPPDLMLGKCKHHHQQENDDEG